MGRLQSWYQSGHNLETKGSTISNTCEQFQSQSHLIFPSNSRVSSAQSRSNSSSYPCQARIGKSYPCGALEFSFCRFSAVLTPLQMVLSFIGPYSSTMGLSKSGTRGLLSPTLARSFVIDWCVWPLLMQLKLPLFCAQSPTSASLNYHPSAAEY